MKIKNKVKVADLPTVKKAMSEYKKNPGSLNAAAFAAYYKAKQMKQDIVVIEGNSMGHRVYHLALADEDLKKYTVMSKAAKVLVVNKRGEAFEAMAESASIKSFKEILIEGKLSQKSWGKKYDKITKEYEKEPIIKKIIKDRGIYYHYNSYDDILMDAFQNADGKNAKVGDELNTAWLDRFDSSIEGILSAAQDELD